MSVHLEAKKTSDKNPLEICYEVFGDENHRKLPTKIVNLVRSYLSTNEQALLFDRRLPYNRRNPLMRFVNLTDPEVLKIYLGRDSQKKKFLTYAMKIVDRIYESKTRMAGNDSKYGLVFPTEPEALAYAMQLARNETVLEIAGASGEHSILLAFSGAKRVYMNDIEPFEVLLFHALTSTLPEKIKDKLVAVEGDCFDLLKKNPEMTHQIGFILCRNLIHFFTDQQQADFFQLLKELLKPGGRAIFMVNYVHALSHESNVFEENPDATCFTTTQCLLTDYQKGRLPCAIMYRQISACPSHSVSFTFQSLYLYEKNEKTKGKWQVNNDQFQKLDSAIRPKIKQAVLNYNKEIKSIRAGSVRVLTSSYRIYSEKMLQALFESHGLEVEHLFVVAQNGHLTQERRGSQQIGAIVRYPG